MKNHTALLHQLAQYLHDLENNASHLKEKTIYNKFDPMLFSENFQPVDSYLNEMQQCFQQLQRLSEQDQAQFAFFTEKLVAQYTALQDAIRLLQTPQTAVENKPVLNKRDQLRQQIELLPPREKLVKYYEALHALNEKLAQQEIELSLATAEQKMVIEQQITSTKQRRERCLSAIELLEEYLAFKDSLENE
ncbi:primosomal replication protein PriC [Lonepinella sp. BR2882]|uniref:primosomal replication protein PriC n=1 Tax=Lonepinella sp. BR2882 TaxID=3095283 RepID=UPI003F6DBBA7